MTFGITRRRLKSVVLRSFAAPGRVPHELKPASNARARVEIVKLVRFDEAEPMISLSVARVMFSPSPALFGTEMTRAR